MRKSLLLFSYLSGFGLLAQSTEWTITTKDINSDNYFGVTVANGITGLVSSSEPFKAKDVVLNGAFDTYGRGRVSNILHRYRRLH